MYKITKSKKFTDQLELEDGNKKELVEVTIDLNAGKIKRYRALQIKAIELQKQHSNNSEPDNEDEILSQIGTCVIDIFVLLFGEKATDKILKFYENDYTQMFYDIYPYIEDVIIPEIKRTIKIRAQQIKKRFK